jgi:large subunit ribosomal protein L21
MNKELQQKEFAVIETGGKQYKVSAGDVIEIEKITGDFSVGNSVTFDKVLLVDTGKDTKIGAPYLAGSAVTATITEIGRGDKVEVVKYRAKSRYYKKNGHRQPFFAVKIESIK